MTGGDDAATPAADVGGRVEVAIVIPLRQGGVLVARRSADQHLGGLWEFPGGKIEPGEMPEVTARRELREETGLRATQLDPLVVFVHDYRDRPLRLHVFVASDPEGEVRMDLPRDWSWVAPEELARLDLPPANRAMLRALHWRLRGTAAEATD